MTHVPHIAAASAQLRSPPARRGAARAARSYAALPARRGTQQACLRGLATIRHDTDLDGEDERIDAEHDDHEHRDVER